MPVMSPVISKSFIPLDSQVVQQKSIHPITRRSWVQDRDIEMLEFSKCLHVIWGVTLEETQNGRIVFVRILGFQQLASTHFYHSCWLYR